MGLVSSAPIVLADKKESDRLTDFFVAYDREALRSVCDRKLLEGDCAVRARRTVARDKLERQAIVVGTLE